MNYRRNCRLGLSLLFYNNSEERNMDNIAISKTPTIEDMKNDIQPLV